MTCDRLLATTYSLLSFMKQRCGLSPRVLASTSSPILEALPELSLEMAVLAGAAPQAWGSGTTNIMHSYLLVML